MMLIIKGKFYAKLIALFKFLYIYTEKCQAGHRDILDDKRSFAVVLGMIDIGSSQVCFLADSAAELENGYKDILAYTFNFKFVLVAFE